MSQPMIVSAGVDPEVFIISNKTKKIVPSCGLIGGTKKAPIPLDGSKYGVKYQEDNVTVEYNTEPARWEFHLGRGGGAKRQNVPQTFAKSAFDELATFLRSKGYSAQVQPEAEFSPADLESEQAATFGCDPDFLAYENGMQRTPPLPEQLGNRRFAGGHIHIGYDTKKYDKVPDWALVRFLEAFVYIPRMLHFDDQKGRRQFYGLGGLYRPKEYGIEYRTPSNLWLLESYDAPYHMACAAAHVLCRPSQSRELFADIDWEAVRKCVDSGTDDEVLVDNLLSKYANLRAGDVEL